MPIGEISQLHRFTTFGPQVITSGGLLTLAHNFGKVPDVLAAYLQCLTAEFNWTPTDWIYIAPGAVFDAGKGCAIYADTTNIYVRFSSAAAVFGYFDKTTGASVSLTNGNWRLLLRAFSR